MYEHSAMYSQFLVYILIPLYYVCALYNCDNSFLISNVLSSPLKCQKSKVTLQSEGFLDFLLHRSK